MNQTFKKWGAIALLSFPGYLFAQKKEDISAIKSMCGCFKVEFNFAETFSPNKEYEFKDRYKTGAIEYIFVDESSPEKIVLQHLLIINDSTVIKHWRQDWEFQQNKVFEFDGNWKWSTRKLSAEKVAGSWTQKVFEVNDAPRYSAAARWVHTAEFPYWEAESNAPLPRREYTKRSDYQILRRNNRHGITATGHVHDQDNQKIVVSADGKHSVLVSEKGYVTYDKTDDAACKIATDWWEKNQAFWRVSRKVWGEILEENPTLKMAFKVNDKMFHEALAEFMKTAPEKEAELKPALKSFIQTYLSKEMAY